MPRAPDRPGAVPWRIGLILCCALSQSIPHPVQAQDQVAPPVAPSDDDGDPADTAHRVWTAFLHAGEAETIPAIMAEYALATALSEAGAHDRAEKHWRRLSHRVSRINGKTTPDALIVRARWAESLSALERDDEAQAVAGAAYPVALSVLGPDDISTDRLRLALATAAVKTGAFETAIMLLEASFDYHIGQGATAYAQVVGNVLAKALGRLGRQDDQRRVVTRMAGLAAPVADGEAGTLGTERALSDRYALAVAHEDWREGETLARALLASRLARADATPLDRIQAEAALAYALSLPIDQAATHPRAAEAEALYRAILAAPPDPSVKTERATAARALASLLVTGSEPGSARHGEGLDLAIRGLEASRTALGSRHPAVTEQAMLVAMILTQAGRLDEAQAELARLAVTDDLGGTLSAKQRGLIALMEARLGFETGSRALAYQRVARAGEAFRDHALRTGGASDQRRELDSWAFLYRGQVSLAWRLARPEPVSTP